MNNYFAIGLMLVGAGMAYLGFSRMSIGEPVEWEHGYKTEYVVGKRYRHPSQPYMIGFTFPKHPHDSDRAQTFDFLARNGCKVVQGGGSPGAELFVYCDGVNDKVTANAKLIEFIPKLDRHIRSL